MTRMTEVKLSRGQRGPTGRRESGGNGLSTRTGYTEFKEKRPEPGRVSFSLQTPIHSPGLEVAALGPASASHYCGMDGRGFFKGGHFEAR